MLFILSVYHIERRLFIVVILDHHMDPFIIIRNYRQQRQYVEEPALAPISPPPRVFLRELDPNALVSRQLPVKRNNSYCEEDKENYYSLLEVDHRQELMKKLPTPNQFHLINYSDYDLNQ